MQIYKEGSLSSSVLTSCLCTSTEKTNSQEFSFSKGISESRFLTRIILPLAHRKTTTNAAEESTIG